MSLLLLHISYKENDISMIHMITSKFISLSRNNESNESLKERVIDSLVTGCFGQG